MEAPPFPPHHPHPPLPPPNLPSTLVHLRSLLSAASSALAALPSPLLPLPATTSPTTIHSPPPTAPLPRPASAVTLPLPLVPAPYSDCPAVVRATPTPVPDSCSLPAFLAAECADFSSSSSFPGATAAPAPSQNPRPSRILPSELGLLRRVMDSWGAGAHHLPGSYSYAAARVAATFRSGVTPLWEAELRWWVLANSPRYGVVIDAAVRDHVWVLVWLCLKAAGTEARCSLERMRNGDGHVGLGSDPRAVRFECPRLAEGVSWLGVQLGILYGEGNGRLFAVAAAKEAMLCMGYCLAAGDVKDGSGDGGNGQIGAGGYAGEKGSVTRDVVAGPVFLSQVAAAIAALYERFSMEEKIKALGGPHPSKYQLLLEYSKALEQGHLERSNRPNYRAVLEYDGILSRRADNQESGKTKTREELLAEERDYKRRRQSYRGKKVKRNPTEILRDIIDEHMEEIKQAGGIGCLVGAPDDIAQNILESNSHGGTYQGSFDPTSSSSYDKAALGSWSPSCENSQLADSSGRVSSRSHGRRDSYKNLRYEKETHGNRYQNLSDHENRWTKESESEIDQSYANHRESKRYRRNSINDRKYAYKHKNDVSEDSDYHIESSVCTARSTRSQRSSVTEYDHMLREGHSDRSRTSQKQHRSVSVTQEQFNDRYDPQSTYSDEDPPTSMLYDITEGKHDICHDEVHRHGHHERKHDDRC